MYTYYMHVRVYMGVRLVCVYPFFSISRQEVGHFSGAVKPPTAWKAGGSWEGSRSIFI